MPKTLEEAIKAIETLTAQVQNLTADKEKILGEKKQLLEFSEKDRENMSENELRLLTVIEQERKARAELEDSIKAESEARNNAENKRVADAIEARVAIASKGDSKVADRIRANVAMLEKMPRTNDAEIDAIVSTSFNMLGTNQPNPLAAVHVSSGGAPNTNTPTDFATTQVGKSVADALGFTFHKEGEDKK